jgi:hypothetical protein
MIKITICIYQSDTANLLDHSNIGGIVPRSPFFLLPGNLLTVLTSYRGGYIDLSANEVNCQILLPRIRTRQQPLYRHMQTIGTTAACSRGVQR